MRLASVNIQYDAGEADRPALVELIADIGADVVAVQEVPGEKAAEKLAAALGMQVSIGPSPSGLHAAVLRRPDLSEQAREHKYADRVWNGYVSSTLSDPSWPTPVTVVCAHLAPHSAALAAAEAQLLVGRGRRQGRPGIIMGDINHAPLAGPEPDWSLVPDHNRSARTVLDEGPLRADRTVGRVLDRAGYTDAAAHLAAERGDDALLAPTGVHGRMRVDQVWLSEQLVPALAGYERLDHRGTTDHHPVQVDLNLSRMTDTAQREWR